MTHSGKKKVICVFVRKQDILWHANSKSGSMRIGDFFVQTLQTLVPFELNKSKIYNPAMLNERKLALNSYICKI